MNKGFTLIELLVVIAIIGVLASLTLANFNGAQARARDTQRKNDIKIVRDALEQYRIDKGYYPYLNGPSPGSAMTTATQTDTTELSAAGYVTQFSTITGSSDELSGLKNSTVGSYIKAQGLIQDPRNISPMQYKYAPLVNGTGYTLETCLENKADAQRFKDSSGAYKFVAPCTEEKPNYRIYNP